MCERLPSVNDANILIDHPNITDSDVEAVFGEGEEVMRLPRGSTMIDVLVAVKAFPSKGQARKNWHGPLDIPAGFNEFEVGKKRRRLFIHNPPDEAYAKDEETGS